MIVTLTEWWQGRGDEKDLAYDSDVVKGSDGGPKAPKAPKAYGGNNSSAPQPIPLIDLRSKDVFEERRICIPSMISHDGHDHEQLPMNNSTLNSKRKSTVVVNLPFQHLVSGERSCELPPRHVQFAILIPNHEEDDTHTLEDCMNFFLATTSKATGQLRKPWMVKQVILDNLETWSEAEQLGILHQKNEDNHHDDSMISHFTNPAIPLPRLWSPDTMIETILLPIIKSKLQHMKSPEKENQTSLIWDLGSGSGRDICFLAEELKFFFSTDYDQSSIADLIQILGIDNHKGSERRSRPLWHHRNTQDVTSSKIMNLKQISLFEKMLIEEQTIHDLFHNFDRKREHTHTKAEQSVLCGSNGRKRKVFCLYAVRYLNRRLIDFIARESYLLEKGCLFAISHFCKKEGVPWKFEHPKESSVLHENELLNLFNNGSWKILHNEMSLDNDHGRTLIHFITERV